MVLSEVRKAASHQRLYIMYGFVSIKWTRRGKSRDYQPHPGEKGIENSFYSRKAWETQ